ncbi:tetratricopeptide repeat protein [Actinoplanes missouriensis]|uniref:tetratricopeptide repeat protein n=1 Tax=Actinoplanes missouriensis TaxID=1866 RepID=UPI0005A09EC4|nr:tetratricopeptide repeat protein [Actinoplanes missouriensis]
MGWIQKLRQAAVDGGGAGTRRAVEAAEAAGRAFRDGDAAGAAERGDAAVRMLRNLVDQRVRAAEPVLVRALDKQSGYLAALGRQDEAVALAAEAAGLARAEPEWAQLLATTLVTYATRLVRAGRLAEALEAEREATGIVEALPEPVLAQGMSDLAAGLAEAGEHAEAVVISERALAMWRTLAGRAAGRSAGRDEKAEERLGQSLSEHADRLSELGRWADAVELSAECVAYRRQTAQEQLAADLRRHAVFLERVGRDLEAIAAAEEAQRRSPASAN